jgi:hypothetical protein
MNLALMEIKILFFYKAVIINKMPNIARYKAQGTAEAHLAKLS